MESDVFEPDSDVYPIISQNSCDFVHHSCLRNPNKSDSCCCGAGQSLKKVNSYENIYFIIFPPWVIMLLLCNTKISRQSNLNHVEKKKK